jgi:trk system potassium uptake protein TrkH
MTTALLVIGTLSYYLLERHGVYAQLTGGQAWLNAFFASVTARTAGFNTVDYAMMGAPALLCTMVLMAIGASPGSTGGGIKTSTFGLLVAFAIWRLRGFPRLHLFGRTVPADAVDRAAAVVVASLALIVLGASALIVTATLGRPGPAGHGAFVPVLFETISAFGTVGLSLGETPRLTTEGKLVISAVMLMGRVGPLTVALAIGNRHARANYRYAEENVMIG